MESIYIGNEILAWFSRERSSTTIGKIKEKISRELKRSTLWCDPACFRKPEVGRNNTISRGEWSNRKGHNHENGATRSNEERENPST
mmetsp:Transcript_14765/g.27826  ORF Transcript_14765/g.27826 Transcript_14765/m.27826 type:complete len:87 (+) Transcript_14765:72-332(+)